MLSCNGLSPYIVRHIAMILSLVLIFGWRLPAGRDNQLLWIVGLLAFINLVAELNGTGRITGRWLHASIPFLSLIGWSRLINRTGGSESPFVAGLAMEAVLAGMDGSVAAGLSVTGLAVVAHLAAVFPFGPPVELRPVILQCFFLLAIGSFTVLRCRGWQRSQLVLKTEEAGLLRRLDDLEERLRSAPENTPEVWRVRLAHGLKNALHSLRGLLALLEEEVPASPRGRRILAALGDLAGDIESFGRLAVASPLANARIVNREPLDVGTALEKIAGEARLRWPGLRISIESGAAGAAIPIGADEFREMVTNILVNAAESMDGIGSVRIRAGRDRDELSIAIEDEGPGMRAELLESPGQPGRSTRGDGRGFGLFIVRRLAEEAGGRMDIRPLSKRGTSVRVSFPCAGMTS